MVMLAVVLLVASPNFRVKVRATVDYVQSSLETFISSRRIYDLREVDSITQVRAISSNINRFIQEKGRDEIICSDGLIVGKTKTTKMYTVSVAGSSRVLALVQENICADAFLNSGLNYQKNFIQVAAFQNLTKANLLAKTLRDVGLKSNINVFRLRASNGRTYIEPDCGKFSDAMLPSNFWGTGNWCSDKTSDDI
ncbi:MAG: hypothetical protein AAF282_14375 [Cyanobacteria bacterium P01_A01_bin.15]